MRLSSPLHIISSPLHIIRHAVVVLRERGVATLLGKVWHTISPRGLAYRLRRYRKDAMFDSHYGTDTGGVDHVHRLDIVGDHRDAGNDHLAVPRDEFEAALALVDIPLDGLNFVDLGSGKGRALLLAAEQPFASIVGVEFAGSLHAVAATNVAARAARLGGDPRIVLIHGDAATYAYPPEPTLLYLFNPFGSPVIDLVAEHAIGSWRDRPRPFRIVYMNALCLDAFTSRGWRLLALERGTALLAPPDA
jgi:SAM-dependent methyltransferase